MQPLVGGIRNREIRIHEKSCHNARHLEKEEEEEDDRDELAVLASVACFWCHATLVNCTRSQAMNLPNTCSGASATRGCSGFVDHASSSACPVPVSPCKRSHGHAHWRAPGQRCTYLSHRRLDDLLPHVAGQRLHSHRVEADPGTKPQARASRPTHSAACTTICRLTLRSKVCTSCERKSRSPHRRSVFCTSTPWASHPCSTA